MIIQYESRRCLKTFLLSVAPMCRKGLIALGLCVSDESSEAGLEVIESRSVVYSEEEPFSSV